MWRINDRQPEFYEWLGPDGMMDEPRFLCTIGKDAGMLAIDFYRENVFIGAVDVGEGKFENRVLERAAPPLTLPDDCHGALVIDLAILLSHGADMERPKGCWMCFPVVPEDATPGAIRDGFEMARKISDRVEFLHAPLTFMRNDLHVGDSQTSASFFFESTQDSNLRNRISMLSRDSFIRSFRFEGNEGQDSDKTNQIFLNRERHLLGRRSGPDFQIKRAFYHFRLPLEGYDDHLAHVQSLVAKSFEDIPNIEIDTLFQPEGALRRQGRQIVLFWGEASE